jgi:hypothetical protein
MKKYLLKLLLWCYRDVVKDFTKLSVGEEFNCYKFCHPNDIVKLIKSLQTANVLWYYEAKDDNERNIVKASSLILKIILDGHRQVMDIVNNESSDEKQLELWDRYRRKNRTN